MSFGQFGERIRALRKERKLPLRKVAAFLDVDQAILSKYEKGTRKPTKGQVIKLAEYFGVPEKELVVLWLADKISYALANEEYGHEALIVAEPMLLAYAPAPTNDVSDIKKKVVDVLKNFPSVMKAWLFGSFVRGEQTPKSDLDMVLQSDELMSYFDLADIQHALENATGRKVDIGMIDNLLPEVKQQAEADLKLIYAR